jgi:hypothetical protein
MARRRRNRDVDIALGVARLVGVGLLIGLVSPQGREIFSKLGIIAICILGVVVAGLVGFGVYRFATRSQRAGVVERNVDWKALDADVKGEGNRAPLVVVTLPLTSLVSYRALDPADGFVPAIPHRVVSDFSKASWLEDGPLALKRSDH